MKLRNKKTGEIISCGAIDLLDLDMMGMKYFRNFGYSSLSEISENWEDYTPKEPLIKDEEICKAVRAWAYINCVKEVVYAETSDKCLCNFIDGGINNTSISFVGCIPRLMVGNKYTITELCGEEEE